MSHLSVSVPLFPADTSRRKRRLLVRDHASACISSSLSCGSSPDHIPISTAVLAVSRLSTSKQGNALTPKQIKRTERNTLSEARCLPCRCFGAVRTVVGSTTGLQVRSTVSYRFSKTPWVVNSEVGCVTQHCPLS